MPLSVLSNRRQEIQVLRVEGSVKLLDVNQGAELDLAVTTLKLFPFIIHLFGGDKVQLRNPSADLEAEFIGLDIPHGGILLTRGRHIQILGEVVFWTTLGISTYIPRESDIS